MKTANRTMKNSFATFLTGTALAVALGLTFALSTPALAGGGGGGGGGGAPAPKVTKVEDPVANPRDEVAEVGRPAIEDEPPVPAASAPRTRDPGGGKTPNKPDERTVETPEPKPEPEVATATVEFRHGPTQIKEGEGADLKVALSNTLSRSVTVQLSKEGDGLDLSSSTVTFQPGDTEEIVRLSAVQDDDSNDERVVIYFGGNLPAGVTRGQARSHVVAVIDDDPVAPATVEFARGTTRIKEGESEDLKVLLSRGFSQPVTVQLSKEGDGLELSSSTVTFQPGDTEEIVRLTGAQDEDSNDEEATISFGSLPAGVTHGGIHGHVVTIVDDDPVAPATVEFARGTTRIKEGESEDLKVLLSRGFSQPVTVQLSKEGDGLELSSSTVTFQPGDTEEIVRLTGAQDEDSNDEEATISFGSLPAGVTHGGIHGHVVTIVDDDPVAPATVEFARGTTRIKEGESEDLKVLLSRGFSQPVTVQLSKEGDGLELSSSTVTFQPGDTEEIVRLTGAQDEDSNDEEATISFGSLPAGVTHGGIHGHVVTIVDDDPVAPATVEFARGTTRIKEGESEDLKVLLSRGFSQPVTVQLSKEGDGLELSSSTVTFQPGDTEEIVRLTGAQDEDSNDEEATISFGSLPAGVTHGGIHGHVVTIVDDDPVAPATVEFTHLNSVVNEGSTGNIQVGLSKPLPQALTFSLSLSGSGTASAGIDVTFPSHVTFSQGETVANVSFTVLEDATPELAETVVLTLADPVGASLPAGVIIGTNSTHTVTIPANDNAVGFASSASTITEGVNTMAELLVTTVNPAPVDIALNVLPAGTATEGTDYTISAKSLVIPAGQTSGTITLTGIDDDIGEGDETVTLALEESATAPLPAGWELGVHTHVITIVDDDNDATVEFARGTTRIKEGETEDLKILLSREFSRPVTVQLPKVGDGLELSTSAVTFQPRQKQKIVKLTAVQDEDGDDEEATISLTLGSNSPAGVTYGGIHSHVVTIIDDDPVVVEPPVEEPPVVVVKPDDDDKPGDGDGPGDEIVEADCDNVDIINEEYVRDIEAENRGNCHISIENLDIVGWDIEATHHGSENGSGMILIKNATQGDIGWDIEATHHGDNKISIENWGDIGWDIEARHYGDGNIEIVNEKDVGWDVVARHSGDGKIEIVNRGDVDWDIEARHSGSNDISIENWGDVGWDIEARHRGTGKIGIINQENVGWDIEARHYGDDGTSHNDISIENWGDVGWDIEARHRGTGKIGIINQENVGWDIEARHREDGEIEISNHGDVGWDIEARHSGDGGISIVNQGTVGWDIYARHSGEGEISIVNQGTVGWDIDVRHSGDNGAIRFSGNAARVDHVLEAETVYVKDIVFANPRRSEEVRVIGNYEALSDTQLIFHIDSDRWNNGDLLRIDGDVTGQSLVSVVVPDRESSRISTNSPVLIRVNGEAQADSFVGEETIGAFDFVLEHNGGTSSNAWRFVSDGISDAADRSSRIPDSFITNIENPPGFDPDNMPGGGYCLWGEQLGSHTVLGFAVPVTRLMGGDMLVGTSVARNSSTSNNISVESQITALTANWERKGFYVGGQTRVARFTSDVSTSRLSVVQDNEGTGINTSMETGYRFNVMNFQISPQAQLAWTRVGFDDFVGPHGELVSLEDGDRVTGSLGLLWDGEWQGAESFVRLYGEMNMRGNLDGKTSVNVSGTSIANEQDDLSMDGKLGLSYEWGEGYAIHGEASAADHDGDDEIRADLGLRIDF